MELSKQEYWNGVPFPTPGALPNPGIKPVSLESPTFTGGFFTTSARHLPVYLPDTRQRSTGQLPAHLPDTRQLSPATPARSSA